MNLSGPNCQFWTVASSIVLVIVLGIFVVLMWGPPELMLEAKLRGYEVVPPPQNFLEAASRFESADPVADARRAVERGDRRLWAVGEGYSLIPGIDPPLFDWYVRHFRVRTMYLTHHTQDEDEARFQHAFYRYTERYNETVAVLSDR